MRRLGSARISNYAWADEISHFHFLTRPRHRVECGCAGKRAGQRDPKNNTPSSDGLYIDAVFTPDNTATGANALAFNNTGGGNTATGVQALFNNTTGSANVALGFISGDTATT